MTTEKTETLEEIATNVVNQIAVGAWQYCSQQWVIGLVAEALRNERERCAKVAEAHEGHGDWCASAADDCQPLTIRAIARAIREGK